MIPLSDRGVPPSWRQQGTSRRIHHFCKNIFPDFFTLAMFPGIEKNNEALNVAIALRKNMGAGCVFIGTLIFWCQSSPKFVAQKLLYCSGFGFFLLVAVLLEVRLTGQAQVPLLILILFTLMALISIYVASRRFQR